MPRWWEDFISLLYPDCCLSCQRTLVSNEDLICTFCRAALPRAGMDAHSKQQLQEKFFGKVAVEEVLTFLQYVKKGKVQKLLHALKYQGYEELGVLLGRWFAFEYSGQGQSPFVDLIVPVPLHPIRKKQRGYNQSDAFAKGLSQVWEIPWIDNLLIRSKQTVTQTSKNREERQLNVEGTFSVTNKEQVSNKHLLLVDDVMTTGATLEACMHPLFEAGCQKISVATIAVVQ